MKSTARFVLIAGLGLAPSSCDSETESEFAVAVSDVPAGDRCGADAVGSEGGADSVTTPDTTDETPIPPKEASEWVAFDLHLPLPNDWQATASALFGEEAESGAFLDDTEFTDGHWIRSEADPAAPAQSRITIGFDTEKGDERRTLAVVPASFAIGSIWVQTVEAAVAKMKADETEEPGSGRRFYLEYKVVSTQGGTFRFAVEGNGGVFTLHVGATSPQTSLVPDRIGHAVASAAAYDTISGTVWFELGKDEFDFFVNRAYGAGAASKQNFKDFQLIPHNWLRLTVEPHLDEKFVDVGFEVVTLTGKRIAVAKAPASILAGAAFQALVDRNMANMIAQEKAAPGSSITWDAPFYYDDPDGGGVVRVVAHGEKGVFTIAYAVDTPMHPLVDVPFVEWPEVVFPPKDPEADAACSELGDPTITLAAQGTLDITFEASPVVRESEQLKGPLVGTIYCSVFRAADVTLVGPNPGAEELDTFNIPSADLDATPRPTHTTKLLLAGDYQTLCYQDLDNSQTDSKGDPVTLPIGGQQVACNKNPVVVEFGLLKP